MEAARSGRIPETVRRAVAMHLAPNASYFERNCDVYWANAARWAPAR